MIDKILNLLLHLLFWGCGWFRTTPYLIKICLLVCLKIVTKGFIIINFRQSLLYAFKKMFSFIMRFWGRPLRCDENLALLMTGCYHTFININDIYSDKVFFKLTGTLHTTISFIMSHLEVP